MELIEKIKELIRDKQQTLAEELKYLEESRTVEPEDKRIESYVLRCISVELSEISKLIEDEERKAV